MNFPPLPTNSRLAGLSIVLAGIVVALAGWALLRVAGVELEAEQNGELQDVGAAQVLFASLAGGIAAWAVFSTMARRPAMLKYWPAVGSMALAISIIGPSYMADGESAMGLIVLHFLVAIVLITGFARLGARDCAHRDDDQRSRLDQPSHHAG